MLCWFKTIFLMMSGVHYEIEVTLAKFYEMRVCFLYNKSNWPPKLRLRHTSISKVFFAFTIFGLTSFFYLHARNRSQFVDNKTILEALSNAAKDPRYAEVYRYKHRLPKDLKYILFWTGSDWWPLSYFGSGQQRFIQYNCSTINCYVTDDRSFLDDITEYDAIAFNGRNLIASDLPEQRSPHQKYIYFNTESSANYPLCKSKYDGYFNWTSTYRLDSDIPFSYIKIKDLNGNTVGPKKEMIWFETMNEVDKGFSKRFAHKSKAAAWFVSNCRGRSKRMRYVKNLNIELAKYGLTVDIIGKCGKLKCPKRKSWYCDSVLRKKYYFYMSMENSFARDYVTEKLLKALLQNTVPIVFGGANYSRFLPPGSYLNARHMLPSDLATTMMYLINSPDNYTSYFKWRNHYSYSLAFQENVCDVCAALNNKSFVDTETVYENIRKWWYPNYENRCKKIRNPNIA